MTADDAPTPGAVRELIDDALSEDEIRDLCFDHFPEVYRELAAAMSRRECIRRLVGWCHAHHRLTELVARVAGLNQDAVDRHGERLRARPAPAAAPAGPARPRPPDTGLIHALPPAPTFVGRADEVAAMRRFWRDGPPGVLALLGLGGAGKTALVSEFLRLLREEGEPTDPVFVWSFYVNQDVKEFLEVAYTYFSGAVMRGSPMGTFYKLIECLSTAGRGLLVLDGLERVQRPAVDRDGGFGDLTDPLLAQIVGRLASGLGSVRCLITSRFPLPRLEPWRARGYQTLDVDQLRRADARRLLGVRGIRGGDEELDDLIDEYGAHALTLDHLSGYLVAYCAGDPAAAASLPVPRIDSVEPQERQLARVLQAYESALTELELAVLTRLCVFRFGATARRIHEIFAGAANPAIAGPLRGTVPADVTAAFGRLTRLHLAVREVDGAFTVHPAVRDHFYRGFAKPELVHQAVRRHFSALVARPGVSLPHEVETLDILEELIYHTLESGHLAEAAETYRVRLGGYQHLAWNLGQYARCIRILTEFPRCPDVSGLIWCYRAVGDLSAARAYVDPDDLWWAGMIGTLRGRLAEVVDLLSGSREDPVAVVAGVLTGSLPIEALRSAPVWLGIPVSPAECLLQAGEFEAARAFVARARRDLADSAFEVSWSDEAARYDLIEAAIAREAGDLPATRGRLDKAAQWIIASGSQEHLCLLHLGRAEVALAGGEHERAATAVHEGLRVAEQCGFGLYHIELRLTEARLALRTGDPRRAVDAALAARDEATDPGRGLVWADATAGRLLAEAHRQLGDHAAARAELTATIELQERINDPRLRHSLALRDGWDAGGPATVA
jgi:tetratricopeptide (TPR) repeat protein